MMKQSRCKADVSATSLVALEIAVVVQSVAVIIVVVAICWDDETTSSVINHALARHYEEYQQK